MSETIFLSNASDADDDIGRVVVEDIKWYLFLVVNDDSWYRRRSTDIRARTGGRWNTFMMPIKKKEKITNLSNAAFLSFVDILINFALLFCDLRLRIGRLMQWQGFGGEFSLVNIFRGESTPLRTVSLHSIFTVAFVLACQITKKLFLCSFLFYSVQFCYP